MATERDREKVACDIAVRTRVSPATGGRGASIAMRVDLTQRPIASLGRRITENGSEWTWRQSGFFILAVL